MYNHSNKIINMKRLFTAMTLMLTLCGTVMAQNEQRENRRQFSPEDMIKHQTERMAEQLSLTEEQKTAVFDLNTKYSGKLNGMHPGRPQGDRKEQARPSEEDMKKMRAEREASMKAYNEELKNILTKEQFEKYEASMKQMRQHGMRGGGPRGGQRGEGGGRPHRDNWGNGNGGNFGNDNGASNFGHDDMNSGF